jgi:hypothetical protein
LYPNRELRALVLMSGEIDYTKRRMSLAYVRIRPAKTEENPPESQESILASFLQYGKHSLMDKVSFKPQMQLTFEMVSTAQKSSFYLTVEDYLSGYFTSQVISHYPKAMIEKQIIRLNHFLLNRTR